jgi:hypothetical protein
MTKGNPGASLSLTYVNERTRVKWRRKFDGSGRGENHCSFDCEMLTWTPSSALDYGERFMSYESA